MRRAVGRTGTHGAPVAAGTLAAFAVLLLSGCVAAPAPPPVTIVATVTATPKPAPTTTPAPVPAEPAPAPAPEPVPNAPAPVYEPGPAVDLGARDGANGSPALDGTGMPVSYVVVSGDSFFDIAQRFDLPQQQLLRMNPQVHDFGEHVYIGDVINLDWTKTG
ncbi:LysM peptidoglycan-binding domain-containing protein [Agromyces laixinhei]|uniref:LysM peptidoglycan-binding domain-containing protein n=1 Tax=Agromyces laixinhei TaxID=2585717 RepID=UPI0011172E1E|nr:LysM domain-containing protein [Agromyces laixinhei]